MRLLIVTQAMDENDPVLGFFVTWVAALAEKFEHIEVVCLKEGTHALPMNVRVHSLGKENGRHGKFAYALRFMQLAWKLRREYDAAFVHMNQEYVLISGWLWKLLGKRVYLWRNHYAGSVLTDIAAAFCTNVFCTSSHSYTAKYRKTRLMPVGVDLARFHSDVHVSRSDNSLLFLARIAPSKRVEILLDALAILKKNGIAFSADIVGSPLPKDEAYDAFLKRSAEGLRLSEVSWKPGIPNAAAADAYRAHRIFVNTSPSGMFDKTIFEAAASGCMALASSDDWRKLAGDDFYFADAKGLAERLTALIARPPDTRKLEDIAQSQSLGALTDALAKAIS